MHRRGDRCRAHRRAPRDHRAAGYAGTACRHARDGHGARHRHGAPHGRVGAHRRHAPLLLSRAAASWRRPRITASSRKWSMPATSPRMRCAQSLQRSRLFAALGHNEDFVATIERTPFPIADGDVFLLCTDGFWEYIDENAMVEALAQTRTAADWLRVMERRRRGTRGQRAGQFLGAGGLVQRRRRMRRRFDAPNRGNPRPEQGQARLPAQRCNGRGSKRQPGLTLSA